MDLSALPRYILIVLDFVSDAGFRQNKERQVPYIFWSFDYPMALWKEQLFCNPEKCNKFCAS